VWDAFTGEAKWQCEGHQKCATDAKFSPDMKYITSSSWDLTIKIWDLSNVPDRQIGHSGCRTHYTMKDAEIAIV
jgi:WD40 repeat protein